LISVVAIYVFQDLGIDLLIQNKIFAINNNWPINGNNQLLKNTFYIVPKKIITCIIIIYLFNLLKAIIDNNQSLVKIYCYLFFSSIIPLLVVSYLKHNTNIYCPDNINLYGGNKKYHKISDLNIKDTTEKPGKCFPAGHASAGYSIISLALIAKKKKLKNIVFAVVFVYGSLMGGYQILRGVHFVGDTFISLMICLISSLLIYKLCNKYMLHKT
jgi:membrane-associated PAP2 superfamily phosphatase